jgi:glycerol-3-phosphate responsive antiterminator
MDGKWIVRISRNNPEILEVINGILAPVIEPLQSDSKTMLVEMLGQGISREEIIAILTDRGELREVVEKEIDRLSA